MNSKDLSGLIDEVKTIFVLEHKLYNHLLSKSLDGAGNQIDSSRHHQKKIIDLMYSLLQTEYAKKI